MDGALIRALISSYEESTRSIVACHYSGTLGIPALFDRSCFGELFSLPDDRGAKAVIYTDANRVEPFEFPAGTFDLDTPADLHDWRRRATMPENA